MSRLDEIEARTNAATEGPWEVDPFIWKPGHPIPPSEWLGIEATGPVKGEVARIQPSDGADHTNAEFIAHARQDVPALVAALRAVLEVHKPGRTFHGHGFSTLLCACAASYPCPTVREIHRLLGEDA